MLFVLFVLLLFCQTLFLLRCPTESVFGFIFGVVIYSEGPLDAPVGSVSSAVGCLLHSEGRVARIVSLFNGLHLQEKASFLCAADVESSVAVGLVALDAGADTFLLTEVAGEFPACGWNVGYAIDGLDEDRVGEANLRHPQSTDHMPPAVIFSLFHSATFVRAEDAVGRLSGRLQTVAT